MCLLLLLLLRLGGARRFEEEVALCGGRHCYLCANDVPAPACEEPEEEDLHEEVADVLVPVEEQVVEVLVEQDVAEEREAGRVVEDPRVVVQQRQDLREDEVVVRRQQPVDARAEDVRVKVVADARLGAGERDQPGLEEGEALVHLGRVADARLAEVEAHDVLEDERDVRVQHQVLAREEVPRRRARRAGGEAVEREVGERQVDVPRDAQPLPGVLDAQLVARAADPLDVELDKELDARGYE